MASISQKQLLKLSPEAKLRITHILEKLSSGENLQPKDVGLLGYSFNCSREKDVADFFHISTRQVRNWVEAGCPKNANGHYDLYQIHDWLLKRQEKLLKGDSEGLSLKDQKTQKEIEKLEKQSQKLNIELDELRKSTVPKDLHDRKLTAQAEAFCQYFLSTMQLNGRKFKSIPDDSLNETFEQFVKNAMHHIVKSGDAITE